MTTLVLEFNKIEKYGETRYITFSLNSKSDVFESIWNTIIKGPGCIIDWAVDHNINISKY